MQNWRVFILVDPTGEQASRLAKAVNSFVMALQVVGWVLEVASVVWSKIWKASKQTTHVVNLAMNTTNLTAVIFR